jgi:serine protease Do
MLKLDGLFEGKVAEAKAFVVRVQSGGKGVGTGIVWRSTASSSEVLTNFHVVANTKHIRVVLSDDAGNGREADAEVTQHNPELDLAMMKIGVGHLSPAPIADSSKLRVGEWVFAIGNPWGARDVVTHGIVSGFGKVGMRGTNRTAEYIRSDVALAPGNSGGPLLNVRGEVIGINAMIMGGDLSVAIPSHVATEWVAGQPDKPVRLGIVVQPVFVPAKSFSLGAWAQARHGLLVMDVEVGGPSAQALMVGDVVIGVGGQVVENTDALVASVNRNARHGNVRLNVLRGGALCDVDVKVVSA